MKTVNLVSEASDLTKAIADLSSEVHDAGPQFVELAFNLMKRPAQLVAVDDGGTSGATVSLLLKPSKLLLDFLAAMRARDFHGFVVKYPHLSPL